MSGQRPPHPPVVQPPGSDRHRAWPEPRAIDALIRSCVRTLFDQCQVDHRRWLAESDLQSMLYAVLVHELPSHGLPARSVHTRVPFHLRPDAEEAATRRRKPGYMDLALVVPSSIHIVRGRHWESELAAAMEVKRGFERPKEVASEMEKLVALQRTYPDILTYMVVMGYQSRLEDVARAVHAAQARGVTLLHDVYWDSGVRIDQPELV